MPLFLAIVYPYVGRLAGNMYGIGGFIVIYLVPIITYIKFINIQN